MSEPRILEKVVKECTYQCTHQKLEGRGGRKVGMAGEEGGQGWLCKEQMR